MEVSLYSELVGIPATYLAIGLILVIAVGAVYTFYGDDAADRRRREMAALAVRRGLTFTSSFSYDLANNFPGFRPTSGPLLTSQFGDAIIARM